MDDLSARIDAQHIVDQFSQATASQKEQLANDLAEAFSAAMQSRVQTATDQSKVLRITSNKSATQSASSGAVRSTAAGTVVDLSDKSLFRSINVIGGSVSVNAQNHEIADIQLGGGADCMFDYLVSTCFATLSGFTEGQTFTALSGCTFIGYSTVQGAVTAARLVNASRVIFICAGVYNENVNAGNNSFALRIFGAGMRRTIINGNNSDSYTFVVNGMAGAFAMTDLTLGFNVTNPTTAIFGNPGLVTPSDLFLNNIVLQPGSGSNGAQFNGLERITNLHIEGTTAATGFTSANTAKPSMMNQVTISGCAIGFQLTFTQYRKYTNFYISGATTQAIIFQASLSGSSAIDSVFDGFTLVNCAEGLHFVNDGSTGSIFTNFTILNVARAVDIRGTLSCITSSIFDNWTLVLGTAGDVGFDFTNTDANPGPRWCQFTNNNFRGYVSGNEFLNVANALDGTNDPLGYHNVSDAGTIADFGNPVGHAVGSGGTPGTGIAANSTEAFVTIGNTAGLSAERALTGGNGVGFTDGGANSTVTAALANLTADWTQAGAFDINSSGKLKGTAIVASGLTGATAASRYVGATAAGAPVAGTFAVGDYIIDQTGVIYVCTVAGSPGTWVAVGAGGAAHNILSATHSDSLAGSVADGDTMIGNATPKWSRLGITIPAANVRNVIGVDNGELRPSWKTALDGTAAAAIGTAGSGTSLVFSHRDHVHPTGAGTPTTQAYSDVAATGAGPAAAMTDHRHGMPAAGGASGGTPAVVLGTAAAAGVAGTFLRDDDTIVAFDTTVPVTQAYSDAAATGVIALAARRDHRHGMPAAGAGTTVATDTLWVALGDTDYGTGPATAARLAGNITTTKRFLSQTGTGLVSAAPAWAALGAADIADLDAESVPYWPDDESDWIDPPLNDAEALDELAERMADVEVQQYAPRTFIWTPDAAPQGVVVAGNQQGNIYHSGALGFIADTLYVDAETAPGASGLPVTIQYGDTNALDTVVNWTTLVTYTLSSLKSGNTTVGVSVPANVLMRMNVGTIVGSPADVTVSLETRAPLTK